MPHHLACNGRAGACGGKQDQRRANFQKFIIWPEGAGCCNEVCVFWGGSVNCRLSQPMESCISPNQLYKRGSKHPPDRHA